MSFPFIRWYCIVCTCIFLAHALYLSIINVDWPQFVITIRSGFEASGSQNVNLVLNTCSRVLLQWLRWQFNVKALRQSYLRSICKTLEKFKQGRIILQIRFASFPDATKKRNCKPHFSIPRLFISCKDEDHRTATPQLKQKQNKKKLCIEWTVCTVYQLATTKGWDKQYNDSHAKFSWFIPTI